MDRLVAFAVSRRFLMVGLFAAVMMGGLVAFQQLNIEAYPDPTPPMVDVVTQSPGLSAEEILRLGALVKAISRAGTAVLLVEHHADLIFDICHQVTVLNLGRVLASGTPSEIRVHKEVVSAYLGG